MQPQSSRSLGSKHPLKKACLEMYARGVNLRCASSCLAYQVVQRLTDVLAYAGEALVDIGERGCIKGGFGTASKPIRLMSS
jgi:hypothetical protein